MWAGLIVLWVVLSVCVQAFAAGEALTEFQRDSLDLAGQWQCLLGKGDGAMWRPEVAGGEKWKAVRVPGRGFLPRLGVERKRFGGVRNVWARRRFTLTAAQAARGAVLKWGGVRFGAEVWINGRQVGRHPTIGPHAIVLPAGLLKGGANLLVMKIPGWAGIPKGKAGYPLIPTGSGTQGWGHKGPAIYDDIWLDFYDRAYIRHALAMPDLAKGSVTFRIALDGAGELPEKVELSAEVRPWGGKALAGRGRAVAGKAHTDLTVRLKDAKAWTPREPNLYVAELTASAGGKVCDRVSFRFGMREVRIRKGRYSLNGEPLWFRGSNLVFEWHWGGPEGLFNKNVKRYIVDEARLMSLNSFRTHTIPPPAGWLDVCDEHGTMIWAELPVLYNYADFRFTREEIEVFHRHALLDSAGWVRKLWNHPSVVLWVLSNESGRDNAWESGAFWKHVRGIDPTRPALRSGGPEGTPDVLDVHTCGNYGGPSEGTVLKRLKRLAAEKDPKRPLSNSEYMNIFRKRSEYALRWLGRADHPGEGLTFAEFAAEHTEAMRRLRYDGILPYMYAGWTGLRKGNNWRRDYPTPMAAALHSSMAPVLASLDLFDRNFTAGEEIATPAAMINELHEDVEAELEVYVTPKDPLFVPDEAALKAAVFRDSVKVALKADSFDRRTVRWKVPEAEGAYYLALVLRRRGDRPVVSQRVVRAVAPAATAKGLKGREVTVLGATGEAERWLKARRIEYATSLVKGAVGGEVAVVWDAAKAPREAADAVRKFVAAGGRLVILNQPKWTWTELLDVQFAQRRSSRAFAYARAGHPVLANVDAEFLKRFNGQPGTVADRVITGGALTGARKLLWIENLTRPVMVSLPSGKGEIIICTLNLKSRIHKGKPNHDPAAERILLNLLQR